MPSAVALEPVQEEPASLALRWGVASEKGARLSEGSEIVARTLEPESSSETRQLVSTLPAEIELAPGSWRLELSSSEAWMEPIEVQLDPGQSFSTTIWPAAWIEARVEPGIESLELRVEKRAAGIRAESLPCPVADRRARCQIPAGMLDLRIRSGERAPLFFWQVRVEPGGRADLGDLAFLEGSSLVGRVAAEARDLSADELPEVEVEVIPAIRASAVEPLSSERAQTRSQDGPVGKGGYFQIGGLAAGLYEVVVSHPKFARGRLGPVSVGAAEAVEIDTIYMPPPTRLSVEVSMPTDPYGGAWKGVLYARRGDQTYLDDIAQAEAGDDGRILFDDLEPGSYLLAVRAQRGATWYQEEVEISAGNNVWPVEVALTRLEGLVTLEEQPLAAYEALFRDPLTGRTFLFREKKEGRFFALLPKNVRWELTLEQPGEGVYTRLADFEVPERRRGDRWPMVELEIPDTRVEGLVVYEGDGLPPEPRVNLSAGDVHASMRVRQDGTFTVRGLPERPNYEIEARADAGRFESQTERFSLVEGESAGPLRLVLQASHLFQGQIVGPAGEPVPATKLVLVPRTRSGEGEVISEQVGLTDSAGVFEMRVPARVQDAWLTLLPPGYGLRTLLVDLASEEPRILEVEPPAGSVVVQYVDPPEIFRDAKVAQFSGNFVYLWPYTTLVGPQGPIGGFFALGRWREWHGEVGESPFRATYPALEAGEYSACFGRRAKAASRAGRPLPAPITDELCASGFLSSGGQLVLEIPRTAFEDEARLLEESARTALP